ncbi:MAG: pyridoxal phosphate-dependent aminotransferase family protein, partial [Nitrospinota bacterium]|nr:pyridoxal phosphate-dependent aminotransferase family protein [Nitrospinota bacterium]
LFLLVEDHCICIFSPNVVVLEEELGVLPEIDIFVGTLGKSLASMGAYVLANNGSIIDFLTNKAGEYIYSTFLTPSQTGAALEAIKLIKNYGKQRENLRNVSKYFRSALNQSGKIFESPIIPILVGDPKETINLQDLLFKKGILVGAVRPPTVPANTSRLRISLNSEIDKSIIDELLNILREWKKI